MSWDDGWYSDDEFKELKEIGGRPDIIYTCDVCGECEVVYGGEDEEPSWTKMFRIEDNDVCEWCIRRERAEKKGKNV
jgi:hypothetical protein